MRVCTNCYKKLYHQMFTPYDYYFSGDRCLSTCCDAEAMALGDGRSYPKIVKELKEKRALQAWNEQGTG